MWAATLLRSVIFRSPNIRFTIANSRQRSFPFMYSNLREFIAEVETLGALRHVADADPHHELGGITEVAAGLPECPALLFDNIKGARLPFRIFTNATVNVQRAALALGL